MHEWERQRKKMIPWTRVIFIKVYVIWQELAFDFSLLNIFPNTFLMSCFSFFSAAAKLAQGENLVPVVAGHAPVQSRLSVQSPTGHVLAQLVGMVTTVHSHANKVTMEVDVWKFAPVKMAAGVIMWMEAVNVEQDGEAMTVGWRVRWDSQRVHNCSLLLYTRPWSWWSCRIVWKNACGKK